MTQANSGFLYSSSCDFEGDSNLANHFYSNFYAFTEAEKQLELGILNIAGSCNATVSNFRIGTFLKSISSTAVLEFSSNSLCLPQDDELQYYQLDNISLIISKQ